MLKKELEVKVKKQNVEIGKLTTSCKEQAKRICELEGLVLQKESNARSIAQTSQQTTDEYENLHHKLHELIDFFSTRRDTLTRVAKHKSEMKHAAYEARGIAQVLCYLSYVDVEENLSPYLEKTEQCAVCAAPVLMWWMGHGSERAWYVSCACAEGCATNEAEARAQRTENARQELHAAAQAKESDTRVKAAAWKQQAEEFAKTIKKLQEVLAQNKHEVAFIQAAISGVVPEDFMENAKPWERLEEYSRQQRRELNALLDLEYYVPRNFATGENPVLRLNNYLNHLQQLADKPVGLEIPITLTIKANYDG